MTRPYIIALFLFGTAILGSLVYLHFYLIEQAENETFLRAEKVLGQVIMDQYEELDMRRMAIEDLLRDDSKLKFQPILDVFAEAEIQIEKYQEILDAWESIDAGTLQIVRISAYEALNNTVKEAKRIMLKHGEEFDLREDDIQHKLRIYDELAEELYPEASEKLPIKNQLQLKVETRLATAELLSLMRGLLMDCNAIGCVRGLEVDQYFPLIIDGYGDLKKGEARTFRFAIGSYSSSLDPDNVEIRVNGKRIPLGLDGMAEYPFLSYKGGEQWLKAECIITNPLTGEVRTGESQLRVNVR